MRTWKPDEEALRGPGAHCDGRSSTEEGKTEHPGHLPAPPTIHILPEIPFSPSHQAWAMQDLKQMDLASIALEDLGV